MIIYQENIAHTENISIEKRGIAKRSSTFLATTENGRKFEKIQQENAYFKSEAKRILNDNQRQMGLKQSEVCVLNTLIRFSSLKSWAEGKPICTATNARIAETSGYSRGTIPNVLKSLEDKGFIFRSYNRYNQRVGLEPISLAPFGSMLSEWEDEALIQWKLNKREQITGRNQTKQEIMITHDDKIEYQTDTKSTYVYQEDLDDLKTIEGSLNNEPRVINSSTKYIDKNTNNKKNIQKKDLSKKLEPVDNLKLLIRHDDLWNNKIWACYDKLILAYDIQDPRIIKAFKEHSPMLMYNSTLELLQSNLPEFNIKLLNKALKGKLSANLWRVGLMILYSLYSENIHSRPKYLCYLCRNADIVHIEDNIKQLSVKYSDKTVKLTMEKIEESIDLSNVDNKQDLFKFLAYAKDYKRCNIVYWLKYFTVNGSMISTTNKYLYNQLENSMIEKFNLKIELVDKVIVKPPG